jgi:uncharacterized protein
MIKSRIALISLLLVAACATGNSPHQAVTEPQAPEPTSLPSPPPLPSPSRIRIQPNYYIAGMRKLARDGKAKAQYDLALQLRSGKQITRDEAGAIAYLRKAVAQNHGPAMQYLAHLYYWGMGVELNRRKAANLYQEALNQGQKLSVNETARIADTGTGTDNDTALQKPAKPALIRSMAEQEPEPSGTNVAFIRQLNPMIVRDGLEAATVWQYWAEEGLAIAQHRLGFMVSYGTGVAQDFDRAKKLYGQAIAQGHAYAQNNMAVLLATGRGMPADHAEAVRLFTLSAEQNFAAAQYNLAGMYARGDGVPQDSAVAEQWYARASDNATSFLQYHLGVMYAWGEGVAEDSLKARTLLELAAQHRDNLALAVFPFLYQMPQAQGLIGTKMFLWKSMPVAFINNRESPFQPFDDPALTPRQNQAAQRLSAKFIEVMY